MMVNSMSSMSVMSGMAGMTRNIPVDTDGSGDVDQSEFEAMTAHMQEMTGEELDVEAKFAELDTDEDGSLSSDELEAGKPDKGMEGLQQMGMMNKPPIDMRQIQSLLESSSDSDTDETDLSELLSSVNSASMMNLAELFSSQSSDEVQSSLFESTI